MCEIRWFPLDDRGLREVKRSLGRGRKFCKTVLGVVDVDAGTVLSLAADSATESELYSLDFGDLSIGGRRSLAGMSEEITAYARTMADAVFLVEDSVASAGSKWVTGAHVLLDDVPCYYSYDIDRNSVEAAVRAGESACLMNGFLTRARPGDLRYMRSLSSSLAIELAKRIELMIVESYDGTGYLLWRSPESNFSPSIYGISDTRLMQKGNKPE